MKVMITQVGKEAATKIDEGFAATTSSQGLKKRKAEQKYLYRKNL